MSKKQYTPNQKKAIESLLCDLDELDNKPRRLYHALEDVAIAFEVEHAIPSIREAQDIMYSHINEGDYYEELFRSLRQYKIEEWKFQIRNSGNVGDSEEAIKGAEYFVKLHIKRLTERKF